MFNSTKIMFKPYICNETLIFPPCIGDLVPQDSAARLVSDIVEQLDLRSVIDTYSSSSDGQPPYHPVMLTKVVLYGYMNNIFSSRGLEQAICRDVHMLWLSSFQHPDHSTIHRFKGRCRDHIKDIFSQLVRILVEKGEIQLSKELYIDGTTIRSRSARYNIKWRKNAERLAQKAQAGLDEALDQLLRQAEEADLTEGVCTASVERTPEDARNIAAEIESRIAGDRRDKSTRSVRGSIKKVREYAGRRDAHEDTLKGCRGRCGVSPTDPDCGIMHSKQDGHQGRPTPNYNVQIATQNQYVTNYDVFDCPDDKSNLLEFVDTCTEENAVKPQAVVADAGYGSEEVYVGLEERGIEAVVKYKYYDRDCARQRRPAKELVFDSTGFRLDEKGEGLLCPAGHQLQVKKTETVVNRSGFSSEMTYFTYDGCSGCPFARQCVVSRGTYRDVKRKLGAMRMERKARQRLAEPINQQRIKRRSLEPKPVFGQLKHNHGYTRFRHFSRPRVRMDLGFELMALNLLKYHKNKKKVG